MVQRLNAHHFTLEVCSNCYEGGDTEASYLPGIAVNTCTALRI